VKHPAVGYAVQRHATGHAQPLQAGLAVQRIHHVEHQLFGHLLDAGGDVGVELILLRHLVVVARLGSEVRRVTRALGEEVPRRIARLAEEVDELLLVGLRRRVMEAEVVHVEPEAAVRLL
jgi:hypothetical protein